MSITTPWKSRLSAAITAGDTAITVTDSIAEVCTCLALPSHMFATLYTATLSERIIITGCTGTTLEVSRGINGTTPRAWPANACLLIDTVVDGAVCADAINDDCGVDAFDVFNMQLSSDEGCDLSATFAELNVGKGLEINRSDPTVPILQVAPTGVTPGVYGGAEVNECGQLVSIPLGWPSNALVDFNPCCDDTGGNTGTVTADNVGYSAQVGSTVATANSVAGALQQVDDFLTSFVVPDAGVQTLTAGDCIAITGTAAGPTVSVAPSGITPGVYDGFTVDACGRVTGYAPPPDANTIVAGTAPIQVGFDGTSTYTVSISAATTGLSGSAVLADEGNLNGNEAAIGGDNVITWDFLQLWQTLNTGIAEVVAGDDSVTVAFDGVSTYTIATAIDLLTAGGAAVTVTRDPATGKYSVDIVAGAIGQFGAVRVADPANIPTPTANQAFDVINSDYLEQWAAARGI